MDLSERLRIALERAVQEGRNVMPDATDDEAHLIESFAAHLLIAVELAQEEALIAWKLDTNE